MEGFLEIVIPVMHTSNEIQIQGTLMSQKLSIHVILAWSCRVTQPPMFPWGLHPVAGGEPTAMVNSHIPSPNRGLGPDCEAYGSQILPCLSYVALLARCSHVFEDIPRYFEIKNEHTLKFNQQMKSSPEFREAVAYLRKKFISTDANGWRVPVPRSETQDAPPLARGANICLCCPNVCMTSLKPRQLPSY